MAERRQTRPKTAGHLRAVPGGNPRPPDDERERAEADPDDRTPLTAPMPLSEAYRRYAPYVAAIALRILGHDDELDDLVQDVFLDATRGIASLREPNAIKGWLARIAVRSAVRRLRKRRLLRALLLDHEPEHCERLLAPGANPEERALLDRVYRTLSKLAAEDRVAWVLRHVQGETLEAAATLLGCSVSTYQRRLRRASEYLARELPDA
ncbi:MAG: RNA polymerase sigma factor [Myxococcales bacterium]|nr:RNA polymerase sigma factor [Myxococcales bacterium]